MTKAEPGWTVRRLLVTGLWFGLVTGALEGLTFLLCQRANLLGWYIKIHPVNLSILWASPLVDTLLFTAISLPLCAVRRWLGNSPIPVILMGSLSAYLIISVPGRLRQSGLVMLAIGLAVTLDRLAARGGKGRWWWFERTLRPVTIVVVLAVAAAAAAPWIRERAGLAQLEAAPSRTSVLLIVVDTLRADHVGSYGYHRPTTPFLDRYAHQATRFENVFANSSWTLPSHASLFTGLLPFEHGAERDPLPEGQVTLAEVLRANGYVTAGFVGNGRICTESFGLAQGFLHWENIFTSPVGAFFRTSLGRIVSKRLGRFVPLRGYPGQLSAQDVASRFLRWVDQRPPGPFFAFLNFMDVHTPHIPPQEFASRFSSGRPADSASEADKDLQAFRDTYDASLAYVDSQLARIFEELERRSLTEDLLVIITSDHGESLGDHGLREHFSSLYTEQIRVPLIVRWPGKVPSGKTVETVAGLHQLPATIAELIGVPDTHFRGPSLARAWSGAASGNESVVSQVDAAQSALVSSEVPNANGWLESVVTQEWHLIRRQDGREELFHWPADLQETHDLADDPQFAAVRTGLRVQLPSQRTP